MKLQYVGNSFSEGLTDGKIYEGKDVNIFCVSLMDDTGMERIYSRLAPGPFAGKSEGRWDII